jgi:hypothetical protein
VTAVDPGTDRLGASADVGLSLLERAIVGDHPFGWSRHQVPSPLR